MPSAKPLRVSYLTRVLHTTRICNVKGIMCVYSIRKMVNFKLDDEMEKEDFFVSSQVWHRVISFLGRKTFSNSQATWYLFTIITSPKAISKLFSA